MVLSLVAMVAIAVVSAVAVAPVAAVVVAIVVVATVAPVVVTIIAVVTPTVLVVSVLGTAIARDVVVVANTAIPGDVTTDARRFVVQAGLISWTVIMQAGCEREAGAVDEWPGAGRLVARERGT